MTWLKSRKRINQPLLLAFWYRYLYLNMTHYTQIYSKQTNKLKQTWVGRLSVPLNANPKIHTIFYINTYRITLRRPCGQRLHRCVTLQWLVECHPMHIMGVLPKHYHPLKPPYVGHSPPSKHLASCLWTIFLNKYLTYHLYWRSFVCFCHNFLMCGDVIKYSSVFCLTSWWWVCRETEGCCRIFLYIFVVN